MKKLFHPRPSPLKNGYTVFAVLKAIISLRKPQACVRNVAFTVPSGKHDGFLFIHFDSIFQRSANRNDSGRMVTRRIIPSVSSV
uniref:Uncharacterized protein n=1 Tax=Anaerolinea thermolimosa TaxID=229919 RepID=A0A7C4KGQ9_9CHLR